MTIVLILIPNLDPDLHGHEKGTCELICQKIVETFTRKCCGWEGTIAVECSHCREASVSMSMEMHWCWKYFGEDQRNCCNFSMYNHLYLLRTILLDYWVSIMHGPYLKQLTSSNVHTLYCLWAACPCLSWSIVAICALTWVVMIPGSFHANAMLWQVALHWLWPEHMMFSLHKIFKCARLNFIWPQASKQAKYTCTCAIQSR